MPAKQPKKSVAPSMPLATAGEVVDYRDSWRIFKIMAEFVEGFQLLNSVKKEVTVLGSARLSSNSKYYEVARELGRLLAKGGFSTITGGGPGIMEAANRGAFEGGGESVGLNIQLPFEQRTNPYVKKSAAFHYFFTRKVMLTSPANASVFFPGGFGTLDEFFEVVDSMELGHMAESPVILVGKDFWMPLVNFVRQQSARGVDSIPESIIDKWHIVETAEEAYEFIKDTTDRPNTFVTYGNAPREGRADWQLFRIMAELVSGFEFLTKLEENVTVLGTKSILPGSTYYRAAEELGRLLAGQKLTVVTGGGPGVMEAANKGAFNAGGESIGINMRMEKGERVNQYVTKSIGFFFPFVRKLIITAPSKAFIFFPGGFGTLHQLFEILTLQETGKIASMPTLLYGKEFWEPLLDYIRSLYEDWKTISRSNQDLVQVVDRPEDALNFLK